MPQDVPQNPKSMDDFYAQYQDKLKEQLDPNAGLNPSEKLISKDYLEFKEQYLPKHFSLYESACNFCEKIIRIQPDPKKKAELEEAIGICHINITPAGATSFAVFFPVVFILLGLILSIIVMPIFTGSPSLFLIFFFLVGGAIAIFPLMNMPMLIANSWRLKSSNQMVLCIFYIVSYMRHTSNLELAIKFTADHLQPPLSLDLKQILWNVETEKYESVKESFEHYMESWRKYNMEFIEAMHLIEASLYESSEDRRIEELEKALSLILEETYEKMLHYAHDLQSPITMLHMLGIILPILGLVILPLIVSFMGEGVRWYHIAILYNVTLPIGVYYLGKSILSNRPTGYGQSDIGSSKEYSEYKKVVFNVGKKEVSIKPVYVALFVAFCLFMLGTLPLMMHAMDPTPDKSYDIVITDAGELKQIYSADQAKNANFALLGYRQNQKATAIIGPFGLGASLLSLLVTLSAGIGIGLYYHLSTSKLMSIREQSRKLEGEFAAALFQLGSRIGDGIPAELAFQKVAEEAQDTAAGDFFRIVSNNITRFGLGIDRAITDPKVGALTQYPSNLIRSSMEVFSEAAKKSPKIASQALINISIYIREMHSVDERLKDLLAETISSMNSQISFLAPAISGIVIGITSMITAILGKLSQQVTQMNADTGAIAGGQGGIGEELLSMFGDGIPTFYFQIIVGLYLVELVIILTIMVNTIQNGFDSLNERYMIGKNVMKSIMMYSMISLTVMLIFNIVAGAVLGGLNLT